MKVTQHPQKPDDSDIIEVLVRDVGWQAVEDGSYETNGLFAHWFDPNRLTLRTVALSEIVGYARPSSPGDMKP